MKVGIDSYCYHRFFGEVYPHQPAPNVKWTVMDFIKRAKELEVDGVSLESCFIDSFEASYLKEIREKLDAYGFDRVYAWGHPDGLEAGGNEAAYDDMIEHMEYAQAIGAKVMRVCGSSLMFRFGDHRLQLEKLTRMFTNAMKHADKYGLKIANENHIDYDSEEMLELIHRVNHPNFGINFDTGNFCRVLDDPVKGMEKLAKYTFATHIKDLRINTTCSVNDWYFFSCTPVGAGGLVNNQKLAQMLKDANYQGFLAMEIDTLHPDFNDDEDKAVADSVAELKKIAANVK